MDPFACAAFQFALAGGKALPGGRGPLSSFSPAAPHPRERTNGYGNSKNSCGSTRSVGDFIRGRSSGGPPLPLWPYRDSGATGASRCSLGQPGAGASPNASAQLPELLLLARRSGTNAKRRHDPPQLQLAAYAQPLGLGPRRRRQRPGRNLPLGLAARQSSRGTASYRVPRPVCFGRSDGNQRENHRTTSNGNSTEIRCYLTCASGVT